MRSRSDGPTLAADYLNAKSDALKHNDVGDTRVMKDGASDAKLLVRKVHVPDVKYPTISSGATPTAKV